MKNFLILLIFLLTFNIVVIPTFAQDATREGKMERSTESAQPTPIDYTLPYPGILSDNPLYFLKALRDRITEFLIADPIKKAEFYLLTADKRLNEAVYLMKKGEGKYEMVASKVSKGENYFEKGIDQLQLARKQNLSADSLIQKYYIASLKHQEVIKELSERDSGKVRGGLIPSLRRAERFEEMLKGFMPK